VKPRNLPPTASVTVAGTDGRLFAPSAARNVGAIVKTLRLQAPPRGRALEIASGTGEHIIRFAAEFSEISWQPTDVDPARIKSIISWAGQSNSENLLHPILLDATQKGWARKHKPYTLIMLSNLLHLIGRTEVETLIYESSLALEKGGVLLIYGPFYRGSGFASEADEKFHQSLQAKDPEIGYKSFQDIQAFQSRCGLLTDAPVDMPANNLMLVARKPS